MLTAGSKADARKDFWLWFGGHVEVEELFSCSIRVVCLTMSRCGRTSKLEYQLHQLREKIHVFNATASLLTAMLVCADRNANRVILHLERLVFNIMQHSFGNGERNKIL